MRGLKTIDKGRNLQWGQGSLLSHPFAMASLRSLGYVQAY